MLSKATPLQDLSIVMVARAMDVTPALIHYYIGGRDWLTSGVMNLFYSKLLAQWPEPTGEWWREIRLAAEAIFECLTRYPGIAAYLVTDNQFRVFQMIAFGDHDYGVEALDRFSGRVRAAGLSPARTGIYSHLIMEFVISTAHKTSHKLYPRDQKRFLEDRVARIDPEQFPNLVFGKNAPLQLDGGTAFNEGIELFHLGMERDRAVEGLDAD